MRRAACLLPLPVLSQRGYVDSRDGYDTVEWAAKQPWSNGTRALSR